MTVQGMHALTREILGAYDTRVSAILRLRKTTQAQVTRLGATRQRMAKGQRSDLLRGRTGLARATASRLQSQHEAHGAMARQQQAVLRQGRAGLAADVAAQLRTRLAARRVDAQHQQTALAKGRVDLARSVAARIREELEARQVMAAHQRAHLKRERADLTGGETRRRASVNGWLRTVAADRLALRKEWQGLTATMRTRRAGPAPAGPVAGTAPAPPAREREAVTGAETDVAGAAPGADGLAETGSLARQVFHYLADHPDGSRLTDLEQRFGLGRLPMARIVNALIDDGRAEKRDLLYFAI